MGGVRMGRKNNLAKGRINLAKVTRKMGREQFGQRPGNASAFKSAKDYNRNGKLAQRERNKLKKDHSE